METEGLEEQPGRGAEQREQRGRGSDGDRERLQPTLALVELLAAQVARRDGHLGEHRPAARRAAGSPRLAEAGGPDGPTPRLTAAIAGGGNMIALTGTALALTPAERQGLRVVFQPGGLKVPVFSASDTTVVAPIPALFTAGSVLVEIPGRGRSNAVIYAKPAGLTGSLP